jgi:hypothetical protein
MNRTAALTLGVLAAATVAAPGAVAAPPKPITKTYTATAPMPDPTNWAGQGYSVCAQNVPGSFHIEEFKIPAAGTLKVELSKFDGDWDSLLVDSKGRELTYGGAGDLGGSEVMQVKFKKAGETVQIVACNWAGGPTGEVTYTFTFAAKK